MCGARESSVCCVLWVWLGRARVAVWVGVAWARRWRGVGVALARARAGGMGRCGLARLGGTAVRWWRGGCGVW